MSKKSISRFTIDAPPETVIKVLTDHDFEIEQQVSQQSTKSASIKEISRSERELILEITCEEYAKGATGINRNKTETSITDITWDLDKMASSWIYKSPHGKRVRSWGSTAVKAGKNGTSEVVAELNIEIKIPLIGGKIEKMVIKETEAYWPTYQRLIRDYCKKM